MSLDDLTLFGQIRFLLCRPGGYVKISTLPYTQRNKAGFFDRKKLGSYAAVTAKAVKPKKDESHIVNISDITAEGGLHQLLQTVLIKYQRRVDVPILLRKDWALENLLTVRL